jgi:hypothetical protein
MSNETDTFWWCDNCQQEVDGGHVTFEEHHCTCGHRVRIIEQAPQVGPFPTPDEAAREFMRNAEIARLTAVLAQAQRERQVDIAVIHALNDEAKGLLSTLTETRARLARAEAERDAARSVAADLTCSLARAEEALREVIPFCNVGHPGSCACDRCRIIANAALLLPPQGEQNDGSGTEAPCAQASGTVSVAAAVPTTCEHKNFVWEERALCWRCTGCRAWSEDRQKWNDSMPLCAATPTPSHKDGE